MTTNPRDKVDSNGSVEGGGGSRSRTSAQTILLASLGLGLVLAGGACSSAMSDQKTGETHFFACKTDSDCHPHGSQYYCAIDHCEVKTDGGGGQAGGAGNEGSTGG